MNDFDAVSKAVEEIVQSIELSSDPAIRYIAERLKEVLDDAADQDFGRIDLEQTPISKRDLLKVAKREVMVQVDSLIPQVNEILMQQKTLDGKIQVIVDANRNPQHDVINTLAEIYRKAGWSVKVTKDAYGDKHWKLDFS